MTGHFSEESLAEVSQMFSESFLKKSKSSVSSSSFEEMDWAKSFKTGKKPAKENPENYHTGEVYTRSPSDARISKTGIKGNNGKRKVNDDAEMLSPVSFPKQKADWGNPPSRQLNGMQMLG
jgi:hypothetical protein